MNYNAELIENSFSWLVLDIFNHHGVVHMKYCTMSTTSAFLNHTVCQCIIMFLYLLSILLFYMLGCQNYQFHVFSSSNLLIFRLTKFPWSWHQLWPQFIYLISTYLTNDIHVLAALWRRIENFSWVKMLYIKINFKSKIIWNLHILTDKAQRGQWWRHCTVFKHNWLKRESL